MMKNKPDQIIYKKAALTAFSVIAASLLLFFCSSKRMLSVLALRNF